MNRWRSLAVTWLWMQGGCSVPSLEELRSDRSSTVELHYIPSFKTGCIVMRAQDEASPANTLEANPIQGDALRERSSPLTVGVLRHEGEHAPFDMAIVSRKGWGPRIKVTLIALERDCEGQEVDRAEISTTPGGQYSVSLITPDEDGDGYVARRGERGGTDCEDIGPNAARRYPGNVEVCDDIDNNCSGAADEALAMWVLYRDVDGDGVGGAETTQRCGQVAGYSTRGGDCDDGNRLIGPDAPEACDGIDNNCAAGIDEGFDMAWYRDADGDGAVDEAALVVQCQQPAGYIHRPPNLAFDCRDDQPFNTPGRVEACDDLDNNYDTRVDEGLLVESLYRDVDGDGVGQGAAVQRCLPAMGFSRQSGDCDDNNAAVAPGIPELCDEVDNNCVAGADEGFDKAWYRDADGDGAVDGNTLMVQCQQLAGFIHRPPNLGFDCHDDQPFNTPGKTEVCDNRDNDCDGAADNGVAGKGDACTTQGCSGTLVCNLVTETLVCGAKPPRLYYPDADRDGDGNPSAPAVEVCEGQAIPHQYADGRHSDCDEADPATFSGAPELCDSIDNNCRDGVDEGAACHGSLKWVTDFHLSSANQQWKTVSMRAGGYPVWIAGTGGKLVVKKGPGRKFESFSYGDPHNPAPPDGSPPRYSKTCGNHDWTASWVDSQGRVFLGGREGWIALHNGDPNLDCGPGATPPQPGFAWSHDITGMVGFEVGTQTYIYISDAGGRLIRWTLGGAPPFTILVEPSAGTFRHTGLHGLREEFLLASGGTVGVPSERVRGFNVVSKGGATITTQLATGGAGTITRQRCGWAPGPRRVPRETRGVSGVGMGCTPGLGVRFPCRMGLSTSPAW
ncbi:putative metal-binding motif-containing protein [Myxococcus stipitatus]|uniref:putative metal-binding motif-containing protein n=1 Tax=Myxococcus stipitatus TaxID=83455 RepID=UPI00314543C3